MSKYRILNKLNKDTNIPVYIVQEARCKGTCGTITTWYEDLKEFISLEDAREYKYQLELINGIVIE
jgi:hypothetical protein